MTWLPWRELTEIRRASEMVDQFKARHGLGDEDANAVHILLDEVLSNSIRHGLAHAASHEIAVTLDLKDGEITMEVEDDGIAFDPTQAAAPVMANSLEEARDGGLGVAFMRALTHSIEYRRAAGRNHLVLRRRVTPG